MEILCSNCGKSEKFRYSVSNVLRTVYNQGWGSYGSALYCPECSKTWNERSKGRPQPGPENTIKVIDDLHRRSKRRYIP